MAKRIGFRHCDPRYPFLWASADQPAARWHSDGEGPANYFADTPVGAWAEFLRHEGITDEADLAGIRRSLWAVELPDDGYASPTLAEAQLFGDERSYPACQDEARRLRATGATRLEVRSAELLPGQARGWVAGADGMALAPEARDGLVWVVFGGDDLLGWVVVDSGQPPKMVVGLVRQFGLTAKATLVSPV
jgi:hypothetical protein